MVCRKVQVDRPSSSTSGGQWGGKTGSGVVVAEESAPAARELPVEDDELEASPDGFFAVLVKYRKAVQLLQGFPSGPITIPGGRGVCVAV